MYKILATPKNLQIIPRVSFLSIPNSLIFYQLPIPTSNSTTFSSTILTKPACPPVCPPTYPPACPLARQSTRHARLKPEPTPGHMGSFSDPQVIVKISTRSESSLHRYVLLYQWGITHQNPGRADRKDYLRSKVSLFREDSHFTLYQKNYILGRLGKKPYMV